MSASQAEGRRFESGIPLQISTQVAPRVGAILLGVKALRAHIHNGQIVLDEPTELPEGAAVEVLVAENGDLTHEERTELDVALEESATQFARGEFEDAHAFARRLVATS